MSAISLRIPDSLHQRLKDMAGKEGVSVNQFIALAITEKISVLQTVDYLDEQAKGGSRKNYMRVLSKVKKRKPKKGDEL